MRLNQEISAFIARRAPGPVCDACVADHLALSRRQVSGVSSRIPREHGFRRFTGRCSGCCSDRRVTVLVWG